MAWHGWSRRTVASMATRRASEGIITVERVRRSDGWMDGWMDGSCESLMKPLLLTTYKSPYLCRCSISARTPGWDSTTLRISACILKIPNDSASHVNDHRLPFSFLRRRIESIRIKPNQTMDN